MRKRDKTARGWHDDERITAPLISWKVALGIFIIMYFLTMAQTFFLGKYIDRVPTLVGIMVYYLVCTCFLLAVLVGLLWRYVIGKSIRSIADAARKVAAGDFSVRIPSPTKGKQKNEIDILIEDFNKMTRELAGNEMLKSDFIYNVSHEIKTPLSIIRSYTKALRDGRVAPEQREKYMDTILSATERLDAMITNILKLNKLENQQIFAQPETYQLGEQLRRCALSFMEQWQAKDIDFSIDVVDVAVRYDASLMEMVWNNLLSNAVKFTDAGGHISLTSEIRNKTVLVTVRNSGCGISDEARGKIFEKFYQGDTSHACEGNGLGLALVKKVLDIVGGGISVDSLPGQYTAFTAELPL